MIFIFASVSREMDRTDGSGLNQFQTVPAEHKRHHVLRAALALQPHTQLALPISARIPPAEKLLRDSFLLFRLATPLQPNETSELIIALKTLKLQLDQRPVEFVGETQSNGAEDQTPRSDSI